MSLALFVLFNHRYDNNLPILNRLYKSRFSNIFYIVPFYDGKQENVFPVYGRSIFFETYVAQAIQQLKGRKFSDYLFVADDMILNPSINENNYRDYFEVKNGESFIPYLLPLHKLKFFWIGTISAFTYRIRQKYVEIKSELPSYEYAIQLMARQDIKIEPLSWSQIFGNGTYNLRFLGERVRLLMGLYYRIRHPFRKYYRLSYPMVASYSDICLISSNSIDRFAHYCGVFGATSLFAEVAIPTALVLSSKSKIKTEAMTKKGGRSYWADTKNVFCESDDYTFNKLELKYNSLDDLIINFPSDALYIHPVKLSKWINK